MSATKAQLTNLYRFFPGSRFKDLYFGFSYLAVGLANPTRETTPPLSFDEEKGVTDG